MNKRINYYAMVILLSSCLSSCATIFGGSKYVAHVKIDNHPNATISFNGQIRGKGEASFKVWRRDANKLNIVVKEEGCETQVFNYTHRASRGWTYGVPLGIAGGYSTFISLFYRLEGGSGADIAGLFVGNMVLLAGIPVGIDAITGAYWKPDVVADKGITKENARHYTYTIDYTGCKIKEGGK